MRAVSPKEPTKILYLRGVPLSLANKLKAAAALSGRGIQQYTVELIEEHVAELERKGQLPKGK